MESGLPSRCLQARPPLAVSPLHLQWYQISLFWLESGSVCTQTSPYCTPQETGYPEAGGRLGEFSVWEKRQKFREDQPCVTWVTMIFMDSESKIIFVIFWWSGFVFNCRCLTVYQLGFCWCIQLHLNIKGERDHRIWAWEEMVTNSHKSMRVCVCVVCGLCASNLRSCARKKIVKINNTWSTSIAYFS